MLFQTFNKCRIKEIPKKKSITQIRADEIRALLKDGMKTAEIADELGVSLKSVREIIKNYGLATNRKK